MAHHHQPRELSLEERDSVLLERILQGLHPQQGLCQDAAHHLPQDLRLDGLLQLLQDLELEEVIHPQAQPDYPAVVGGTALQQRHPVFAATKIWLVTETFNLV